MSEDKIARKCHWCDEILYVKDIIELSNARGYGYYIICPKCNNRNVIQEIDLVGEIKDE